MKQCSFIKPNKEQCKAKAVHGDSFCFWHSKKMEEKRLKAIKEGGESPKRNYGRENEIKISSTKDILTLIEETVNDLRGNKVSTRVANAIGYLAGIALKAVEQSDLEKRLEVIEYALKIKKGD